MNTGLLEKILSIPTAPFREQRVLEFLSATLDSGGVPHFFDPTGNMIAGVSSAHEYQRVLRQNQKPLYLFIAHTDHPGFHGQRWLDARRLVVRWHGGSPTKHLKGAAVWACAGEEMLPGRFTDVSLNSRHSALARAIVTFDANTASLLRCKKANAVYGGFRFRKPIWKKGKLLFTKAADDLVGAFAVVTLALAHKRKCGSSFLGLLTRAEEVGFIGALEHFRLDWLSKSRREVICVSLETSRQLPGALVGRGPIVRLGDRATVFDPAGVEHLTHLAATTLGKKYQRRIMDGGTCEGTAANAHGMRTLAMSVPLGNYHNQSFEGGQGSRGSLGPAPEFIHLDDVKGMIRLCTALIQHPLDNKLVWQNRIRTFNGLRATYRSLMRN